jgi:hypothetical protein
VKRASILGAVIASQRIAAHLDRGIKKRRGQYFYSSLPGLTRQSIRFEENASDED